MHVSHAGERPALLRPLRMFCWHCEERLVGKLCQPEPGQPYPNCARCPTWDDGCAQAECEECW